MNPGLAGIRAALRQMNSNRALRFSDAVAASPACHASPTGRKFRHTAFTVVACVTGRGKLMFTLGRCA